MDPTIKKILKTNHVDGIFHTHVSLIRPKGKFQFNRQTLEDFWEAYCNFIQSNEDAMVGIAEKPQQYLPILVDVDLRIRDEGDDIGEGLYTEEQLQTIVETYQSTLRQIVDGCTDDDLVCAVLEKKMYQQTKNEIVYFKHGFHLHFPYIFLNKIDQEVQLIPRVQQTLKDMKLFANLGVEDSGNVIDKVCCKVPWLLYGSRKTEENHPYKLTKIYDANLNKISLEKAFKHYKIFDHKEQEIAIRGKIEHYLPRIFSIVPYGRGTKEIKRGVISPIKEKLKKERKSSANYRTMGVEEALNIARQLLPMIADFRADDRNEWMTIGWCLYNISDGHTDALDLWCEFSSRCEDKYDESACIYQWDRMTKRDLTIGTLRHYASIDNPVEYKKYKEEQANKHIMASLDGSHNDVAKALYAEYNDEFVCASVANKVWFQFIHNKWEQIEEGTFLREKISGRIVDRYIEAVKKLYDDLRGCQDKAREAMVQARIKQVQKMIGNLKSAPYKNNVMKECVCEGSLVTLSNGLSMKIENMRKESVLAWNGKGLECAMQSDFIPKGKKRCIRITLQDGSNITVTPDHKILLGKKWLEAQDLKVGDNLHMSLSGPVYEYETPQNIYSLNVGSLSFSNKTPEENLKLTAFSRILGFLITDGTISTEKKSAVVFGLNIDAESFLADIELVTGKRPEITLQSPRSGFTKNDTYIINLPYSFSRNICALKGVPIGRRTESSDFIPEFITDSNCPLDVVREFLASMWGGDGHRPTYNKKQNIMRSIAISKTKDIEYEMDLDKAFGKIKNLLARFGICNVTYNKRKTYQLRGKTFVEKQLNISMQDYLKFAENIGVRYSTEKSLRFCLFTSYMKMRQITENQYNKVVDRIRELSQTLTIKDSIEVAYQQICTEEIVLYPEYVKPTYSSLCVQLRKNKNTHKFQNGFPKVSEFFQKIGASNFCEKYMMKNLDAISTFQIPIVDIRDAGYHNVYDITVDEHHSFVANGIVVHNCMEVFYDSRFREKLDSDPYLICFKNGVYDLRLNTFRPGRPEDFLSKNMPINYVSYSEDDEKVGDVHTFLEQVFPDKTVRKYFLDVSSDIFVGGNHEKIVLFWTGEGDNGKSITQLFFELMMGKLAIKLNTNVITGKKPSAGAAFADLARAGGGVRWAVLEEPDADEMINTGIFKHLSGNDTFYARDLFEKGKDGREICPMFKLAFICLAKGTSVSLPSGISISIEKLANNTKLLGYDEKQNGLVPISQQILLDKGRQNCLTIILQDGRKVTCTHNHKFMTWQGDWIEARNIIPGITMLKMGIDSPNCDDMCEPYNYKFFDFNLTIFTERCRAGALCRLVGYLTQEKEKHLLYVGNKLDADQIIADIELVSGIKISSQSYLSAYKICVPDEIVKNVQLMNSYMFDSNCPTFLVREFLATAFTEKLQINWKGIIIFKSSNTFEISEIIRTRFGIESTVFDHGELQALTIDRNNMLKFQKNIGFRYAYQKTYQLTAFASAIRYKNSITDENKTIDLTNFFNETGLCEFMICKGDKETLPCYRMIVTNVEESGLNDVYDIVAEEPYSNFVAEGIVTHNCNKLPRIKAADKAVWNRVRVIPFEATFCRPENPAPESYEEQLRQKRFPMDKQFSKKIPGLVEAFAWILLQHRVKIANQPRGEPEKVRAATEIYRRQNDIYRQFVEESIVEDPNKSMSLAELYNLFKEWFKESLPGHSLPVKNEVEEYFAKIWGLPEAKRWKGYRQKTLKDDIENGDAIVLTEEDLVDYNKE